MYLVVSPRQTVAFKTCLTNNNEQNVVVWLWRWNINLIMYNHVLNRIAPLSSKSLTKTQTKNYFIVLHRNFYNFTKLEKISSKYNMEALSRD